MEKEIFELLPAAVQSAVAEVRVLSAIDNTLNGYTSDKLFLPAMKEIYNESTAGGASSYESAGLVAWQYYSSGGNRVKQCGGSNDYWWSRSRSTVASRYCCVNPSGGGTAGYNSPTSSLGVSPCFCI